MQESFLHFVWQYQHYDTQGLQTTNGGVVDVFATGHHNTEGGPDFLQSKLKIDGIQWFGSVEIHVNSSDWEHHQHHKDPKYNTVILHVVWHDDRECRREDGEVLPVLELKSRVSESFVSRYKNLINQPAEIPCQSQLDQVRTIDKVSMCDQVGVERLRRKSKEILERLEQNKGSWEDTAYQTIAQNFGFKKNAESMLKLSNVLTHKILLKHLHNIVDIEALVYGVAGFLEGDIEDGYHQRLADRYQYLSQKYNLKGRGMLRVEWEFLRMRPWNFPTIRLAQLASFFTDNAKFFDRILNHESITELKKMFVHPPSEYWQSHYDFDKESARKFGGLGSGSLEVMLINSVAPILAAYSQHVRQESYMDRAVQLLQSLKPEQNHILDRWEYLGIRAKSAFDSQALIELKNEFCLKKKCLSCKIGIKLISD
ncbi:hypothetical protein BFP72_15525 [Reichenbachiella sp. 5M10]|uniref:DUF2851 family protein n=1 Tax=Reichenbachiella sp. 5M10 TaxID=1889772 RepID=UPI000C14D15C|nr:DUF2851 family protein [Reichenbachiella sp. 5M10]PIB36709.1 hypothetical protein BFP72_15525 [Reichenbachiella sp. 5M10]